MASGSCVRSRGREFESLALVLRVQLRNRREVLHWSGTPCQDFIPPARSPRPRVW